MSTVVVDAVEHLVRGIVDNPDDVRVDLVTSRRGRTVEVHVHPDDLGKVIGRGGGTPAALRPPGAGIGGRGHRGGGGAPDQGGPPADGTPLELIVGRVVKAHGLTGEIVVEVRTDDPELRFAPGAVLRAKGSDQRERNYAVVAARMHGTRLLVRLAGVADRDGADALRGSLFVIDSADLPP